MAENSNTPNKQNVDLEKTFQFIGDGFSYIFSAIGSLFKMLLHYIILGLIFLRKNFIILTISTIIGAVSGYFLDKAQPIQTSEMIIEANFGSGHRLYKQIDLLNTLISKQDSIQLGNIFEINPSIANKLLYFEVQPYSQEENSRVEYDYYMHTTDTIFTREFEFSDFKKRKNDQDYRKQSIYVDTHKGIVFPNLKKGIFNLVINERLQKIYYLKKQEFNKRKELINTELNAVDTLRKNYSKAELLAVTNTQTTGTSINLRENKSSRNKDIDLFNAKKNLIVDLARLNKEIVRFDFIMNVVSDFSYSERESVITSKKWIKYGVYGFIFSLFIILGFKLNAFIGNYQKK